MVRNQIFKLSIYFLIFLLIITLIACTPASPGAPSTSTSTAIQNQPVYGGTLIISSNDEGLNIGNPGLMGRIYPTVFNACPAVDQLFKFDTSGKMIPWLVSEYKTDPTAKTITLILKTGIKFHDNTDFNAEAVKWNLDNCITSKASGTSNLQSIDIIDDYTVRINLKKWDTVTISEFARLIGFMISPTAAKKNGLAWANDNPVGTGPFKFVSWQKNIKLSYTKWDNYWQKGKPYLDNIEFRMIPDNVARNLSFLGGEAHITSSLANDVPELLKKGFEVKQGGLGVEIGGTMPDSANPSSPWADLKVRQAFCHAVDNDAINKSINFGVYETSNQIVTKKDYAYNPDIIGYQYNPTKAKQLLTEAGYPNGFKTKLQFLSGQDLTSTAIQGYLKAVGIDAELSILLSPQWDKSTLQGGGWQGLTTISLGGYPDIVSTLSVRLAPKGPFFISMMRPDDFIEAVNNAQFAVNQDNKQKWAREAIRLMIDKYCLYHPEFKAGRLFTAYPKVHDHGVCKTITGAFTPESCWIEK